VEYDGTDFVGWQRQENGLSVQETLETALERLTGDSVRVLGAGRTDAGVHALGQVAAFSTSRPLKEGNVVRGGNAHLPPAVRIRSARAVSPAFNPRRDGTLRIYRYALDIGGVAPALAHRFRAWIPGPLNWDRVVDALAHMRGIHDFKAFRSSQCTARRTRLHLRRADLTLTPRGSEPGFGTTAEIVFECRSFLHNMVRMLVGAALEAGRGRLGIDSLERLLCEGIRGSTRFPTAPARGLCLMAVAYPPSLGLWKEN